MKVALFILGWVLFVLAQAQNSVQSTTNGLSGWAGFWKWIKLQAVNLATRAFFSGIFYGYLVQVVAAKVQAAGLGITGATIAGVAGYSANALLYQVFGLLPWLRVEIGALEPPASSPAVGTNSGNVGAVKP
jgi:hypothetical protein